MLDQETFKRLVIAIRDTGDMNEREINGTLYKVCEISELSLVLVKYPKGWAPEGITFELFGIEFFLTSDGSISIIDEDETDNENVYSLSDQSLLNAVSSFLKWRLKVLEKLMV